MDLKTKINPAPIKEPMAMNGVMSKSWANWFSRLFDRVTVMTPSVSADNGDAAVTLTCGASETTQRFNAALTAARIVTLSSRNAFTGASFRIIREQGATGPFGLDVGPGLKTLGAPGQWCLVEYAGNAWMLVASGSL